MRIGHCLGFDALAGIDDEQRAFTGGQSARNFVGEIDVAGRVDEVENVLLTVARRVIEAHGAGFDGDAALALQVHRVEHLVFHVARGDRISHLKHAIRERTFAVVDVRDDGKIANVALAVLIVHSLILARAHKYRPASTCCKYLQDGYGTLIARASSHQHQRQQEKIMPRFPKNTLLKTALLSGCLSFATSHAGAQETTNPYTGRTFNNSISSYLDTVIMNQQQSNLMMNQQFQNMMFNQMIMDSIIKDIGNKRIVAGKASTRFVPSAKGSQIGALAVNAGANKAQAIAANTAALTTFNEAMQRLGLTPNDVADGRALAFNMAFNAYASKDPGPTRLKNLRAQFKSAMMKDPMFQAKPDDERQAMYEKMAIPAVFALSARQQAHRKPAGSEQREVLITTAERMGEGLLKSLWDKPIDAIELSPTGFADRGERVVQSGAGKTTFQRSADSTMVATFARAPNARQLGWDEKYYTDLLSQFDETAKKLGLQTDDLADAQVGAAFVVWPVYSGGKNLNAAQIAWVRREMRKDILSDPNWQRLSDAQKQDQYEGVALKSMHIAVQNERSRQRLADLKKDSGDAFTNLANAYQVESAQRVFDGNKDAAYRMLKEIFSPLNFDDYALAPDGFRKR